MELEMLRLGRSAWATFEQSTGLEWLETNGLGGWAFGTVPNVNTRFYHAVLAAAVRPPVERLVLLARLEESLTVEGARHDLYANHWASGHIEQGSLGTLHSFALAPFPTWTFMAGDVTVQKRLFMRHESNTTVIRYRVRRGAGKGSVTLRVSPLVTCRSIHEVAFQNEDWPFSQERLDTASVSVEAYVGAPRLYLAASGGEYQPGGMWVCGIHYRYEEVRGEHTREDLYLPGQFVWTCDGEGELTLTASTDPSDAHHADAWEAAELERRRELVETALAKDDFSRALVLAADQFVVRRGSTGTRTVIAGYPWFTDWGRDTMISLPGLTFTTRRYGLARELLHTFAAYEQEGLIPNCFPEEGGDPLYNTADASLWFVEAVWQYMQHTADDRFVRDELYPVLLRIARSHVMGTRFDIRANPETGLLRCGNPHVQVTWMDAKVGDWVVTPRNGMPVEIQALWYNAVRILAGLCARYGDSPEADGWRDMAERLERAFEVFWNPSGGYLYDLVHDDGTTDPAVRPNQLFALTLSHPLLSGDRARSVVDTVFRELWTPYGLRSLSPRDPAYVGRYEGNRRERDAAYHQGTVWAWLTGPFVRAYLHAYGRTPDTLAHARTLLEPLRGHLLEFGLGTIGENFDGDPPYQPRACVAQAWSVAELLRLWREEY